MKENLKTMPVFKTAPLPFQGQKRRFIETFKQTLNDFQKEVKHPIIVDLFGGSGLLSHTAQRLCPDAEVVYNDYDDYHIRLEHVLATNAILQDVRSILAGAPKEKKLDKVYCDAIYKRLEQESGFVDYITLSSSLLFSMNYELSLEALRKNTLYNNVKQSDYNVTGYLEGIDIVKMSYSELFEQYRHNPNVLFLVDPPYLSTDCSTYASNQYWKLSDYLNVINVLKGTNYVYFTSNKSSIIELCQWIEEHLQATNPFKDAIYHEVNVRLTPNAKYVDIMLHKFAA